MNLKELSKRGSAEGLHAEQSLNQRLEFVSSYINQHFPRSSASETAHWYLRTFLKRYSMMLGLLRLRPPGRLLSLGVSYGLPEIVAKDIGWEVVGTDYREEKVRQYASAASACGVEVHTLDLMQEPLRSSAAMNGGFFDMVWACEVLEHIRLHPGTVIGELCEAVAPGGRILITLPNASSFRNVRMLFRGRSYVEDLLQVSRDDVRNGKTVFDEWMHVREPGYQDVLKLVKEYGSSDFSWDVWLPTLDPGSSRWDPKAATKKILLRLFPFLRDTIFALGARLP